MRNMYKLSIILAILINFCLYANILAAKKTTTKDNLYKEVFKQIEKKNWQKTDSLAKKLHDKTLSKIILSQKFLDKNYKDVSFKKIITFLKENPKWPQNYSLRVRAESLINNNSNKREIYQWFNEVSPITGNGYKYHALSAARFSGDINQLIFIIKDGWIYGNFTKNEQLVFYRRFKKFIDNDDTIKRIDNLIWKGSVSLARSLFALVNPKYKKAFEAQIAFSSKKKNAQKLFKNVSKNYYTPGLVYHYLNSKKNDFLKSSEIVNLINSVKHYQFHENSFVKVQDYIAREYLHKKKYKDAYKVAAVHFATSSSNVSNMEFLAGWISLRFLKKPKVAIKHFKQFSQVVKTPISVSRGLYWLARSYKQDGQKEEAKILYKQAASKFSYTFYGQMANLEIGTKKLTLPSKPIVKNIKNDFLVKNNENLKATNLVIKYSTNSNFKSIFLENLIDHTQGKEIPKIAFAIENLKPHHKIWISRRALRKHIFIDDYAYPNPYKTKNFPVEKSLVYSIIRQESSFEKSVIASDGGMGLMQLMKPTACDIAKKLAMKCQLNRLTRDANYNIALGGNYLKEMLKKHQESYILAIAAYNAGPHRMKKWIQLNGDLRKFKHPYQVIDWIESIPFPATKNYVQRVLENLQIYRVILDKNSKFKLKSDLLTKK